MSDRTDNWLEALLNGKPLLKRWLRFRIDSVLDIVKETKSLVNAKGMRLGLDLFSPAFAEVVGYDLTDLSKLADWVKPMTYQFAMGPAGLRLETSALIEGLMSGFGLSRDRIFEICRENIPWFTPEQYQLLKEKEVPMEWIESEMRVAVQKMTGTPVYFGIECVSFPGVIDVHPEQAAALVQAAMNAGGDGAVLSWDLMHMPIENLRAMRKVYDESRS